LDVRQHTETASRKAVIGPVLAGFLLDLVDFATYGPIGIWAGAVVGGLAGYFLAMSMGVEAERRWPYAAIAGAYCMLPFTAFLPLATVLGTLIRLREGTPPPQPPEGSAPTLEAEYRSRWDDD
jgi:hypothetical protein